MSKRVDVSKMTEKEILIEIYKVNQENERNTDSIRAYIMFVFWLSVAAGIIIAVFT